MSDPTPDDSNRDKSMNHACVSLSALGAVTIANLAVSANWTNSGTVSAIVSKPWACLASTASANTANEPSSPSVQQQVATEPAISSVDVPSVAIAAEVEVATTVVDNSASAISPAVSNQSLPQPSAEQSIKGSTDAGDSERLQREEKERSEQQAIALQVEQQRAEQLRVQQELAQKELAEQQQAEKERIEKERADAERVANERTQREQAEKDRALEEKAAKELAAKELAAKELATKELATKELAAKELVAKELAAKELAAKELAAKEQAAKELAAKKQAEIAKAEQDRNAVSAREQSVQIPDLASEVAEPSIPTSPVPAIRNRAKESIDQSRSLNLDSSPPTSPVIKNRTSTQSNARSLAANTADTANRTRTTDAYLQQLEQLVLQLNLELAMPQGCDDAETSEQQIQALTQRLINLSLENLELRRRLATECGA